MIGGPLPLPGGMSGVTGQNKPSTPLLTSTSLGNPKDWKPRTRHVAIRKKAFGPAQVGKAFNKS